MKFHDLMGRIYGIAIIDTFFTLLFSIIYAYYYKKFTFTNILHIFIILVIFSIPIHIIFKQETRLLKILKLDKF